MRQAHVQNELMQSRLKNEMARSQKIAAAFESLRAELSSLEDKDKEQTRELSVVRATINLLESNRSEKGNFDGALREMRIAHESSMLEAQSSLNNLRFELSSERLRFAASESAAAVRLADADRLVAELQREATFLRSQHADLRQELKIEKISHQQALRLCSMCTKP